MFVDPLCLLAPWPAGLTIRCNQGNFGAFSHNNPLAYFAWDFGLPLGTPVVAAAKGGVFNLGYSQLGYGNFIVIRHGRGIYSIYGHLDEPVGNVGESIRQGMLIGYSGSTGITTGPHLHFSLINAQGVSLPSWFADIGIPVEGGYYQSRNHIK